MVAAEGLIKDLNPLAQHSSHFDEGLQSWRQTTSMEWPPEPAKQRSWDEALMNIKVQNLLNDATDVYNQKRLQSLQNKNAGDWLNAVPSRNLGTFLNDDEIRPVLCLRLGLPYAHEHLCKCGIITDSLGKHCFSCKKNPGKASRHHMLNRLISHSLTAMGMPNSLEPANLYNSNGLRPDGVTHLPLKYGKSVAWDFTSPHPLCPSHLHTSGSVAELAEKKKNEKYASLQENYCFTPIAIDTLGSYGPQASQIIGLIGKRLAEKHKDRRRLAFLRQSLGIAIQRGNALTMLFSLF
jgi:hypothetical protein